MLGLIKSTYEPCEQDSVYLRELRTSRELCLVKEICIWWRCFQIENYCPLTSEWLKQQNLLEHCIEEYYQNTNVPSYIEQAGIAFLEYILSHIADSVAHSIAAFERAMIQVKRGDLREYIISWDYEPYAVLSGILYKTPYDQVNAKGQYKVAVSYNIPGLFNVVKM
ncbi:hypothetical protein GGD38_003859 [Chitinophagaceae bacterium OAS944]|nr:hypothetical protein [Chitinophagaceae bacterium OAS944]